MYREDGEAVWTCELNSYGKVRNFQGEMKTDCPFRFQGQYEDSETGLYYNRFRYYSPDEGMYLSQDPIGLWGGSQLYGYVHNPNTWVDSFGLEEVRVYHYTNKKGYDGISGTGKINQSDPSKRGKGASIGKPKGVYVTTISPEEISKANLGQMGLTNKKTEYYVSFEIEKSKIRKIDPQDSKKRLYIQEDINLRDKNNKLKKNVKMGKTCPP